ncbi:DUF4214 domain-containing protein [Pseudoduganella sp. RAF53_2]|uniref:DUF4214 domain-containing protein n=1 Tax=unclassified Pseudoduganella TaxID=2637179 RepID=UPI003F96E5DC
MTLTTGNNSIDSLVYSSWNYDAHTPVTLTYSFLSSPPSGASSIDRNGFMSMTAIQKQAVATALQVWADVANVSFQQVSSSGELRFGTNDQSAAGSAGYAYLPEPGRDFVSMYLDNTYQGNTYFGSGSVGMNDVVHEIGHMLGLKHPGDYDAGGASLGGAVLPKTFDNEDYSIMSYTAPIGAHVNGKYPGSPMLYDIQAIQYLYGPNMSYRVGDDSYSFFSNSAPQCIWDAGGNNTFDFSNCLDQVSINLNAGTFSETSPGLHNISIAYGVSVQHAIAGSGGSVMIANDLGDVLTGGPGNDQIEVGKGNDVINGGGGNDSVIFHHSFDSYGVVRLGDSVTVIGEGIDTLQGIESLRFSDQTLTLADLPQAVSITGTAGNDILYAQTGDQRIEGGAGIDTLVLNGPEGNFRLNPVSGAVVINDALGGIDVLTGVERLQFSDGALALDVDGTAGQLYRLYGATFDRAPDDSGLGYWLHAGDSGTSLESIASGFTNSQEFILRYGSNLSDAGYVTQLYHNVLHRDPDAPGFADHMSRLAHGVSREDVLLAFSESVEYIASLVGVMPNKLPYIPYTG